MKRNNELSLLIMDSKVQRVNVFEENYKIIIECTFNIPLKGNLIVTFIGVEKTGFYYDSTELPYVVDLKLFKIKDTGYYISIDPYGDYKLEISEKDNWFIHSKDIDVNWIDANGVKEVYQDKDNWQ